MFSKKIVLSAIVAIAIFALLVQPAMAAAGQYKVRVWRTVLYNSSGVETKTGFWNGTVLTVASSKMMAITYTTWWGATRTKTVEMAKVNSNAVDGYVVMSDLVAK